MEISCRVYKPRRARESPLFRLVEQHLEELLHVWPVRFARQHGPLRPVVERVLRGFMRCGLVEHGLARLWCPACRTSVICTDGGFSSDGVFHPLGSWDADAVMKLFRERLLARLVERHAISEDLARKLVAWTHPGFSSHIAEPIPFENKKASEDLACYLVRAPFSLHKLVYLDGQQAVVYRSRMNPSLGRNFEAMDPLEWLARLADHIPDPGRHRTHFYAHYANRVRGERPGETEPPHTGEAEPRRRRCSSTWARLIAKVFQADPLVCRRCGGPLKVAAYITDALAIRQILEHLNLSPPEKPPPEIRDVVRVPVDDEGREIDLQPAGAVRSHSRPRPTAGVVSAPATAAATSPTRSEPLETPELRRAPLPRGTEGLRAPRTPSWAAPAPDARRFTDRSICVSS